MSLLGTQAISAALRFGLLGLISMFCLTSLLALSLSLSLALCSLSLCLSSLSLCVCVCVFVCVLSVLSVVVVCSMVCPSDHFGLCTQFEDASLAPRSASSSSCTARNCEGS